MAEIARLRTSVRCLRTRATQWEGDVEALTAENAALVESKAMLASDAEALQKLLKNWELAAFQAEERAATCEKTASEALDAAEDMSFGVKRELGGAQELTARADKQCKVLQTQEVFWQRRAVQCVEEVEDCRRVVLELCAEAETSQREHEEKHMLEHARLHQLEERERLWRKHALRTPSQVGDPATEPEGLQHAVQALIDQRQENCLVLERLTGLLEKSRDWRAENVRAPLENGTPENQDVDGERFRGFKFSLSPEKMNSSQLSGTGFGSVLLKKI